MNEILVRWWIQIVFVIFGATIFGYMGWWTALWEADQTKISFLIISIFVFITGLCGYICVRNDDDILIKNTNYIWFASEAMLTLGMIGTVAGFMFLFGDSFSVLTEILKGSETIDTNALLNIIVDFTNGIGIALTTTLTGLVCSLLTKLQMVIIENGWNYDEVQE